MEAKVLPFRRPNLVVFERFEVEDMSAMFRSKKGADTYYFVLMEDGEVEDFFIRREMKVIPSDEFTPGEQAHAMKLAGEAAGVLKHQLATWGNLLPGERLSLLINWGEDTLIDLRAAIKAAVAEDLDEYAEEIALMLKDLDNHHSYIAGLETARSLL